jgi:hypothetical protein
MYVLFLSILSLTNRGIKICVCRSLFPITFYIPLELLNYTVVLKIPQLLIMWSARYGIM